MAIGTHRLLGREEELSSLVARLDGDFPWTAVVAGEAGRSNREVAATLFLTEHSVETALTRIYRKLGVRSRTELGSPLRTPAA